MKLRVYKGEWFFNMGIVGFLNILEKAELKGNVLRKDDYIEFDSLLLENFHDYYFDYFMDEYNMLKRIKTNIDFNVGLAKKNPEKTKDVVKRIKNNIKQQNEKIKKFDLENYELIKEKLDCIGKIKSIKEIEELEKLLEGCIDVFKIKSISEKLTANLYKYIISDNYFGQVSYFNVAKSKLSLEELKMVMYGDYLLSIISLGELDDLIKEGDIKNLEKFIIKKLEYISHEKKSKIFSTSSAKNLEKILKDINKNFIKKKKSIEDIKNYMDKLESCEMCGMYKGIIDEYSESSFVPLGVSNSNAKNMFWNQEDAYEICDICKLILFCTPAGATYIRKNYLVNEDNQFYGFVNTDSSINDLCDKNNNLKLLKDKENPFNDLIINIVMENEEKSRWQLNNILFVEFKASVDSKKCKMNYFNMPTYLAEFFVKKTKLLQSIYNSNFKASVVDILLKNKDLKHLISDTLRDKIKGNIESNKKTKVLSSDCFKAVQIRAVINNYKKGVYDMNDKKLQVVKYSGHDIHDYYVTANAKNKIDSVAYKLLNAVRVGNKKDFMDTVLRVFMSAQKSIPSVFLEIMSEKDLDFESIGHAFISGLISERYEGKNKENNGEEK